MQSKWHNLVQEGDYVSRGPVCKDLIDRPVCVFRGSLCIMSPTGALTGLMKAEQSCTKALGIYFVLETMGHIQLQHVNTLISTA